MQIVFRLHRNIVMFVLLCHDIFALELCTVSLLIYYIANVSNTMKRSFAYLLKRNGKAVHEGLLQLSILEAGLDLVLSVLLSSGSLRGPFIIHCCIFLRIVCLDLGVRESALASHFHISCFFICIHLYSTNTFFFL